MFLPAFTLTVFPNQLPAAEMQWILWILPALLATGTGFAIWKLQRWDTHYSLTEVKWFIS